MSLLRCLFRVDDYDRMDAESEPAVYIVNERTVSSVRSDLVHIGWASPPRSEYELALLGKNPGCVWVVTKIAPIHVVG